MKVAELIAILQNHDPAAEVVVGTYDDRSDVHHVLELRPDDVRAIAMREVSFERPRFDVDRGAKLFEVDGDGLTPGVELG
jgi:hypothetical protein